MDEAVTRRSPFYRGREIKLADGQSWILPSPRFESGADFTLLGPDYRSLLRAVREAEDEAERLLSELALAIFLLGCNYELSPIDYQQLLGFPPGVPELVEVQREFHRLARDHLGYASDDLDVGPDPTYLPPGQSTTPGTAGAGTSRRAETPGHAVKGLAAPSASPPRQAATSASPRRRQPD